MGRLVGGVLVVAGVVAPEVLVVGVHARAPYPPTVQEANTRAPFLPLLIPIVLMVLVSFYGWVHSDRFRGG